MAPSDLYAEPTELYVGTAVAWRRSFADWTPADGAVSYAFQPRNGGAGGFTKAATDPGDGSFRVALETADTAGKSAGSWSWVAKIVVGAEEFFLDSGDLEFRANPFAGAVDLRSSWEKIRDNIRTAIETEDNSLVASYSIDNLSLAKASKEELFDALAYAEDMVAREREELAIARGEAPATRSTIRLVLP